MSIDPHLALLDSLTGPGRLNGRVGDHERRIGYLERKSGGAGGGGLSAAYTSVQDEGTGLTARSTLDFIGTYIQAADDSTNNRTTVTLSPIANADIASAAAIAYSKLNLSGSVVNADISASAAIAYSKLNLTGSIVNADIATAAAIAYSKLNLAASIVNADISATAAIAYSKLSLTGSIVNADISAAAAIAYSKLNLSGSIVNADVSASAAIAYSKLNLTGSIVNADIASAAAIAWSKMSGGGSASGDLAGSYPGPTLSMQTANHPVKPAVVVAATTNITVASPGASIDGVSLSAGQRVLLTAQTTGTENGLYVWNGAASAMTRVADANASAQFVAGFLVPVQAGTANGGSVFVFTNTAAFTLGTSTATFGKIGSGAGIRKFTATIGDGINSLFTLAHGLGTADVGEPSVKSLVTNEYDDPKRSSDATNVYIDFGEYVPASNEYRVIVLG